MTSRYDDFAEYRQPNLDLQDTESDFFELLSAYIDGEASSVECQQVQHLLDNDPEVKKIYLQLLQLQGGMQNLSVPINQGFSPNSLAQKVFAEVERSRRQRKLLLWGSGVIVCTIIAAISSLVPSFNAPNLKLAESGRQETVPQSVTPPIGYAERSVQVPPYNDRISSLETPATLSVMVAVTLNQPTVTIPKAAISEFPLDLERDY